jgi:uncharacterized protein YecE (DUF72 family)
VAPTIDIGTAGWSIPRQYADRFPAAGTGLQRYATEFPVVEINSSFHRPHHLTTWERWRDSVPPGFRFSAKLPKEITHVRKLVDCGDAVEAFLMQAGILGDRLSVLLVQLPPKLAFDKTVARAFFREIASRSSAIVACEPRHPSWFTPEVNAFLEQLKVARVAADPAICPEAATPGGWRNLSYWRLHGSPVVYRSSYEGRITRYAAELKDEAAAGRDVWCIFDNTASSAGLGDALKLIEATRAP